LEPDAAACYNRGVQTLPGTVLSAAVTKLKPGRRAPRFRLRTAAGRATMMENLPQVRGSMALVRRQAGFSLIELIIVIAIILAVAGFAVPQFMQALRNYRIAGDARNINGEIMLAKMRSAANFTWSRVFFDRDNRRFITQLWNKEDNLWEDVAVGGPQSLSSGVTFGVGPMTDPPPGTQDVLALAPPCKQGTAGNPGADPDEPGNTSCIMFNSRGFPVDDDGAATGQNAIYITDEGQTHGVTVSITGLTRIWRGDTSASDYWIRR
jgi:prepilin-type N-terminal cleavage/methylation domain-containing protein